MATITSVNDKVYQKILLAGGSFWGSGALKKELDALSPHQLKIVLERLAKGEKDFTKLFNRLSEVVPMDKLQEAIREDYPNYVDALHASKEMFEKAQYQLEHSQTTIPRSMQSRLSHVLDSIILGFENVIGAFGIAEFFSLSESPSDIKMKEQIVIMLLDLFALLTTLILPMSGATLAAMIIAGALLSISAISLIYPYIKPMPSVLPKAENWTRAYWQSELPVGEGRQETVDELAKTLMTGRHSKVHPMLIGPSGVGKTETVKMLVAAIERGEYPALKGKKVFYINTADLVNLRDVHHGDNRVLMKISEIIGRHKDQVILVFDEIHTSCAKIGSSVMGEQLKTMLDSKFPYVIGLTTEEEFYQSIYQNNPAFARRFKLISVGNTDETATVQVLNNVLLRKAPEILVDPQASRMIYRKSMDAFGKTATQPAASLDVLSQCFKKTAEAHKSPLEAKAHRLRVELASLKSEEAFGQGAKTDIAALQNSLRELETRVAAEQRDLEELLHQRDRWMATKAAAQKLALKAERISQKELKQLMILNYTLLPHLEQTIRQEAKRLGVKLVLDADLIDQTIREMTAQKRKALSLISH